MAKPKWSCLRESTLLLASWAVNRMAEEPLSGAEQEPCHSASAMARVAVHTDLQSWRGGRSWWREPSSPGPARWAAGEREGKNNTRDHKLTGHVLRHLQSQSTSQSTWTAPCCRKLSLNPRDFQGKTDQNGHVMNWNTHWAEERRGQEGGKDRRADNHVWKPHFHFQLSSPCILNMEKPHNANPNSLPCMALELMEGQQIHRTVIHRTADSSHTPQQEQLSVQLHAISWGSEPSGIWYWMWGRSTRSEQVTSICTGGSALTRGHEALKWKLWAVLLSNLLMLRAALPPPLQLQDATQEATGSTVRSLGPILCTLFKHPLTSGYLT